MTALVKTDIIVEIFVGLKLFIIQDGARTGFYGIVIVAGVIATAVIAYTVLNVRFNLTFVVHPFCKTPTI